MLSRIAEALYWIGRYTERAEGTARLLDVTQRAALEGPREVPLALSDLLGGLPGIERDRGDLVARYALDRTTPESIASSVRAARENARTVREAITSEMWEALNTWHLQVASTGRPDLEGSGAHAFFTRIEHRAFLVAGAADATMLRDEGWHWLVAGRHLERMVLTVRVLGHRAPLLGGTGPVPAGPTETYGWSVLLRSLWAYDAYRKTFRTGIDPRRVVAFLLLDPACPRSALWSARLLETALLETGSEEVGREARRWAGRLRSELEYRELQDVLDEGLGVVLARLTDLCGRVHGALVDGAFARGLPADLREVSPA